MPLDLPNGQSRPAQGTFCKLTLVAGLLALTGSVGCGSNSSDAKGDCENLLSTFCDRYERCFPTQGTAATCLSEAAGSLDCSEAVAVTSNYNSCMSQIPTYPCASLASGLPPICSGVILGLSTAGSRTGGTSGRGTGNGGAGGGTGTSGTLVSSSTGKCVGTPQPDCPYACLTVTSLGGMTVDDMCQIGLDDRTCQMMGSNCHWYGFSGGGCKSDPCEGATESACSASGNRCFWMPDTSSSACKPAQVTTCAGLSVSQCTSTSWCAPTDSTNSSLGGSGGSKTTSGGGSGNSTSHASCIADCTVKWSTCTSNCQTYGNYWEDPDSCKQCEDRCTTTDNACELSCPQ